MVKNKVSIISPARNEIFLTKTIKDVLSKASGDIEYIAVLDGYWPPAEEIVEDPRVIYLHNGEAKGMRASINKAASMARGEYLLKLDAHCMVDEGFDEKLKADHTEDNWLTVPRRHRLDAENWTLQEVGKPPVDYEFLSSPADDGAKGNIWNARTLERMDDPKYLIDENITFQGSCWFMTANHYNNRLGQMSEEGYGTFVREAQEIGLKTWLGGGKVMTNKKTWYAHLHKGKTYGRMYPLNKHEMDKGNAYCDDFWFNNRWTDRKYDLAWLIERFMPVPTWTPELIEQVRAK